MTRDRDDIWTDWKDGVNMTPSEIEEWLGTDASQRVGAKPGGGGESTGHESGRRIVTILRTRKADLTEADWDHMSKVTGYIARHTAQRPDGDVTDTDWRYSLKNWGHDPVK